MAAGTNTQSHMKLIGDTDTAGDINSAYWVPNERNRREGIFQVEITAAATVLLLGRKGTEFPWETLDTFTASGLKAVALMPHMSISWTGNTGTINAGLVD